MTPTVIGPGTDDSPTHVYNDPGDYTVIVTADDGTDSNTFTFTNIVHVERRICTVPDFQNTWAYPHDPGDPGAQARWADNEFTTTVTILPDKQGNTTNNYKIKSQTLTGGTDRPNSRLDVIRRSRSARDPITSLDAVASARRGQALVEFALVFPIIVLLLLGDVRHGSRGLHLQRADERSPGRASGSRSSTRTRTRSSIGFSR